MTAPHRESQPDIASELWRECPICHDANKFGDYEGPTCEVCLGAGWIATPERAAALAGHTQCGVQTPDAWRPIETAPKNGEPVLIYVPIHTADRRILSAYWTDVGWWICSGSIVCGKPTLWMPLPTPSVPSADGGCGRGEHCVFPDCAGDDCALASTRSSATGPAAALESLAQQYDDTNPDVAKRMRGWALRAATPAKGREEIAIALLRWGAWHMTPDAHLEWKKEVEEFLSSYAPPATTFEGAKQGYRDLASSLPSAQQARADCGGEGQIQTHADGRGIECPTCHNANKYGDYEGPTCEVCMGDGFVAATSTLPSTHQAGGE